MCYVNAVISVEADTSKKKTSDVKTDNGQRTTDTSNEKAIVDQRPLTIEKPKVKVAVVNEPPATPNDKPATRNPQPTTISKSKKLLTLDSLNDVDDSSTQKLLQEEVEEKYQGEVLLLNKENILQLWNEYAANVPEGKKGLRIGFANYMPELDETSLNKIYLKVQSNVQKTQFDEVRLGIQNFISKRVGAEITFEVIADKKVESGSKPYTPKEKFERLMEKNPSIKKMQQQFGLELDYD